MKHSNPLFHEYPERSLPPYLMHKELQIRHRDRDECTLATCDMMRYCWTALVGLGHNPEETSEECAVCAASPPI